MREDRLTRLAVRALAHAREMGWPRSPLADALADYRPLGGTFKARTKQNQSWGVLLAVGDLLEQTNRAVAEGRVTVTEEQAREFYAIRSAKHRLSDAMDALCDQD